MPTLLPKTGQVPGNASCAMDLGKAAPSLTGGDGESPFLRNWKTLATGSVVAGQRLKYSIILCVFANI